MKGTVSSILLLFALLGSSRSEKTATRRKSILGVSNDGSSRGERILEKKLHNSANNYHASRGNKLVRDAKERKEERDLMLYPRKLTRPCM
jgi:hypothetical protein